MHLAALFSLLLWRLAVLQLCLMLRVTTPDCTVFALVDVSWDMCQGKHSAEPGVVKQASRTPAGLQRCPVLIMSHYLLLLSVYATLLHVGALPGHAGDCTPSATLH
jgi:hypothetical protein